MTARKAFTPAELRDLAKEPYDFHHPHLLDALRSALLFCADVIDAANEALREPTPELSTASAGEAFTYGTVDNVPFPPRILALIKEAANREYIKDLYGNPCFGPMEDGNGDPLQDDADAALAWIEARSASPAPGRAPLTESDLPTHPEPHSFAWTEMEKRAILKWGNSLLGIAPAGGIGGE